MNIRLVKREDIDKRRWNGCVHYSPNSLIYGYTWYLDNVSEAWEGLVEDDYQSVFPLTYNTKLLGVKRLLQPLLCQQLGLFTVNGFTKERIQAFVEAIPKEYRQIDINLNESNIIKELPGFEVTKKPNYLLSLNHDYEELYSSYSSNVKRNIKKAYKNDLFNTTSIKPETFVAAVKTAQQQKGVIHPEALYHAAHRVIYNCLHRGLGFLMVCMDKEQEIHAAIFWTVNGARFINLLNVTTQKGRKTGAMHFLLDSFIQNNSNKIMYVDFEGSSIPSIARFYESFGAEPMDYYNIKQNRLPWWLRWKH